MRPKRNVTHDSRLRGTSQRTTAWGYGSSRPAATSLREEVHILARGPSLPPPPPICHHMSSKAWGSLSRHHSMEAYTVQTYLLKALDTWSSRSRCQQGWGLMRPLLLTWGRLPCPPTQLVYKQERDLWHLFLSSWGHQSYSIRAPPLWPHRTLIIPSMGPSLRTVTLGVRSSNLDFKGAQVFPGGSDGKESACNARDLGSIPG